MSRSQRFCTRPFSVVVRNDTGDAALEPNNSDHQYPQKAESESPESVPSDRKRSKDPRLPRSVQAIYLKPLKRKAQYGLPCCDLQLRSYSVRNVEFFADFALRAAYYLGLPASGPVPLPRITERWTVPRSNFIFKKSQENFERITLRRLIQIQDGHTETVEIWLAFLRKHAYYGIGMKANVWQHEKLGEGRLLLKSTQAYTIHRGWEDHGCQSGEFEAVNGAEVGTFWTTEYLGDFRKGLRNDE